MKRIALLLCLMAVMALAGEPPKDTVVGRWIVDFEDSAGVARSVTPDGWYTVVFSVPPKAKPGDTIMVARVQMGRKDVFLEVQADVRQTQDLLWQIKAKLDSAEKKP